MKKVNSISIILFLILSFWSCGEEQISWELETNISDLLIVEGIFTNESKVHQIIISSPMTDPNGDPEMISGALVTIFVDDKSIRLRENEPGIYETGPNARAVFSKVYTLYIFYQGKEYYATTWMIPVSPLDNLSYQKVEGYPNLYMLNLHETNDPSMVEIFLDWSHLPAFNGIPPEQTHARIVYYTVNSIDVNEMFKPGKEIVVFPAGTKVLRKKYSLSAPQENFVRTLMAETEWRGGSFDVQPGNVITNLSEGAIGYFSASTVVADSSQILPLN
jgi:hypothetical protein